MLTTELATYVKQRRISGWKKPAGAVSCTRGKHPTPWGNRFAVGDKLDDGTVVADHEHAVFLYGQWFRTNTERQAAARRELAGKTLMCWCAPGAVCHVQSVLMPWLNEGRLPPPPATYMQRRRGWRRPAGAVMCDGRYRPAGDARFAVPIGIGGIYPLSPDPAGGGYLYKRIGTPADLVEFYRIRLRVWTSTQEQARRELPGKVLVCRCAPGEPCHVQDVLIPLVNEGRLP